MRGLSCTAPVILSCVPSEPGGRHGSLLSWHLSHYFCQCLPYYWGANWGTSPATKFALSSDSPPIASASIAAASTQTNSAPTPFVWAPQWGCTWPASLLSSSSSLVAGTVMPSFASTFTARSKNSVLLSPPKCFSPMSSLPSQGSPENPRVSHNSNNFAGRGLNIGFTAQNHAMTHTFSLHH
jgi:hypothetical protein